MRTDAGARDGLAIALATLFGAGRSPLIPGTAGTLAALPAVVAALVFLPGWQYGVLTSAVALVGVWAGGAAARSLGDKDPGSVVIDEAAGLFVTLWGLPPAAGTVILGFVLFRVMDVVKPPPAGRAERLPGGWGIMADDLVAGVYANVALRAAGWAWRGFTA